MASRTSAEAASPTAPRTPSVAGDGTTDSPSRTRSSTTSTGRLRSASIRFLESSPPSGMWHATGVALAQAPNPMEIRRGEFSHDGWDGPIQRRNSNVSLGGLSRVSSAQTPGSLARAMTNPLGTHAEVEHEGETKPKMSRSKTAQTPSTAAVEEDDPFTKFVGRGRIDSQVYTPGAKRSSKAAGDPTEVEVQDDDDEDDADSLEDIDPRQPVKRRSTLPKKFTDPTGDTVPKPDDSEKAAVPITTAVPGSDSSQDAPQGPDADGVYPNGYKFPPKHTWGEATVIGLKGFWRFFLTPTGFLITLYGLNVVAWGGMLFLLLIGGGKEFMCYPPGSHGQKDCNNINAPRRIWIEIDSQILNALFCVTGFGLIPWRFRDLYYLLRWRIQKREYALRKLAGIHRAWFRLPGSQELPATEAAKDMPDAEDSPSIPLPIAKAPDPPLTGFRAPQSKLWKLDYVIWAYIANTALQACLSGFMWGLNRYNRPSWSTGLFVALACIVAGLGGLMCFFEGKRIKAVEGIPVEEEKVLEDVENGVEEKKERKEEAREKKGKGKD